MGKVRVWASQLWANDFPPVCAMTGRPAETWKKFKFATPPDWTYALLIAWPICWLVALITAGDPNASGTTGAWVWLGIFFLLAGMIGRLVVTRFVSPRAKVMELAPGHFDRIVELRNVHPLFVAAVLQRQQAQASQHAYPAQSPYLPGST